MTVSSTANKVSYSGNGSLDTFAYTFKIFADSDLKVFIRTSAGTETLKTISTHYTVTNAGVATGGNVVFTSGNIPASGETVVIQRELTLTQGTDYVENDPFPAQSHEDALDRLTFVTQQMQEELDRSIKASVTNTITNSEFTVSATDRANKVFAFDGSGNLSVAQELGTNRGDWAASTSYAVRDLVKDTSTGNIFFVNEAHTSSGSQPLTTNANSAKYDLIVDAASATTSASAAASSATAAASSASTASTQASNASTSASTSSTQASNAASSATAAASSATAAAASATSAAASLDAFDDNYLGAKSSDPSTDNDGDALTAGDLYFNTSSNVLKVYNGSAWQEATLVTTATTAELNYSDTGAAVGTVVASKVVTADANKDVASFRNITLTGELDAGSLDVSGDADIDGTLEADAMTLNGTAITATATLDTGISNNNVPKFTSGVADNDFLRVDGTAIEGRSASEVLSDIGAQASLTFGISNTNAVKIDSSSVADDEYARFTANGLESRATSEVLSDIGAAPAAGSSNIVTTGALNSGSITSGFGAIDNGSSAITTTGVITGGTVEATADTSAGDNAAIGYTAAEGLILTGQGSTSDITLKNDADAVVFTVPTGTDDILFPDNAKAMFGDSSDLQISHNASASVIEDLGEGNLKIKSNGSGINFQKGDAALLATMVTDGAVTLYNAGTAKFNTSSTGATIAGKLDVGSVGASGGTAGEIAFGGVGGSIDGFRIHNTDGNYLEFRPSSTDAPMVLNNVGNVGIGIDSPTLDSSLSGVSVSGSSTLLHIHDDDGAIIKLTDPSSGANRGAQIAEIGTAMIINNCESDKIIFGTGNTQRMQLTSSGNLRLGQSGTDHPGSGNSTTGISLRSTGDAFFSDTDSAAIYGNCNSDGTVVSIAKGGTAKGGISVSSSAVAFNTTSDRRLKSNIQDAASASDKIDALQVRQFDWNVDGSHQDFGLVAQELQPIAPTAVLGDADSDEMMSVDYSKLVPMLIKEIQELRSRVAALEAS